MIAYTKRSITPSSQLDSPSPTTCETMSDDVNVMTVSKLPRLGLVVGVGLGLGLG